ncbi:hypothetical protein AAF712_002589 [Marasmius tenuissimus]|uniref:Uncharacterized protein n=1 Tax=Marasmius tenuissimus TaxID=585030 RepID=A0ABR3A9P0_9AGAR
MFSSTDGGSPTYISSHSADVILSDMRPIKLKIDALCSINVLLDEFLFNILKSSRSLTTNKLRAGLLSVLPTTLGKEALLEAEVELRAYWDRTRRPKGSSAMEDDSDAFNLQWAFELLRLKCEAYSTLNESDEDLTAESKLHERMAVSGHQPPKPSLVAPAALYLTAILEAMCEHILSNVGRVAARDSSRTTATLQDVFVALCEDDSIYSLFKTMNGATVSICLPQSTLTALVVYEHIEQQAQETKPRRSKSISRTDKLSISRNSSQEGMSSTKGSFTPPRLSSEGSAAATTGASQSRTSSERARSMKKFIANGRNSGDRDTLSVSGHKKSDSVLSEHSKQAWASYNQFDDDGSLQEFDDLMRSDATMKVSLTPDRLKTMEIYKQEKQEKDQRVNRKRLPDSAPTDGRRPSLRNVDSIQEDEEESQSKAAVPHQPRARQSSVASLPSKTSAISRARSTSASGLSLGRKSSKGALKPSHPPSAMQTQSKLRYGGPGGKPQGFDADPFPPKTRKIQHNRESLDLDEVMAGSDAEEEEDLTLSKAMSTPKRPSTNPKPVNRLKVSANTRELMEFLNEGPPESPSRGAGMSKAGRELMEFLDNGPPHNGPHDYGLPPVADTGKSKGSGRLQRMMSKLSIGGEKERLRNAQYQEDFTRRTPVTPMSPSTRGGVSPQSSTPNFSALANRPVPPRPPQPQMISPPSSPTQVSEAVPLPPVPAQSQRIPVTRKIPSYDLDALESSAAEVLSRGTPPAVHENGHAQTTSRIDHPVDRPERDAKLTNGAKNSTQKAAPPSLQMPRKTNSAPSPNKSSGGASVEELQALRQHISRATNSDECRLIMDMFFAKAGILAKDTDCEVPYPSPTETAAVDQQPASADTELEISLVELLLGGERTQAPPVPRKKKPSPRKLPPQPTIIHQMNGRPIPISPDQVVKVVKD